MCGVCGRSADWASAWFSRRYALFTFARFAAHRDLAEAVVTTSGLLLTGPGRPRPCPTLDDFGAALAARRPPSSWDWLLSWTDDLTPHRPTELPRHAVPAACRLTPGDSTIPGILDPPDETRDLFRLAAYVWGLSGGLLAPTGLPLRDEAGPWAVRSPSCPS